MNVVADTCWFIDLERRIPSAIELLKAQTEFVFLTNEVVRAELYAGGRSPECILRLLGNAAVLAIDERAAQIWGETARHLRSLGQTIGVNDLWIAASALANQMPIVSRNVNEFNRVPGLKVIGYE